MLISRVIIRGRPVYVQVGDDRISLVPEVVAWRIRLGLRLSLRLVAPSAVYLIDAAGVRRLDARRRSSLDLHDDREVGGQDSPDAEVRWAHLVAHTAAGVRPANPQEVEWVFGEPRQLGDRWIMPVSSARRLESRRGLIKMATQRVGVFVIGEGRARVVRAPGG